MRTPLRPIVTCAPRWPAETDSPDLLTFNLSQGASLIDRRNRIGILLYTSIFKRLRSKRKVVKWDRRLASRHDLRYKYKVMHPRTKETLAALKVWTEGEFGRKSQLARALGVSPSLVTDWLNTRRNLSADQIFQIQDFLDQQKPGKKK